ncbi:MAG: hypothetical protein KF726_09535 [Anaerolineae bacterium]|nr:hypothetical protein [Anaerolineae bacterium]
MLTADVDTNIMIYGSRSQAQVTAFDVGRGYISVGELMLQYGKPLAAYTSPPTGKTKRTRVCFADFVCAYLYHRSSRLTLTSTVFVPRITFRP